VVANLPETTPLGRPDRRRFLVDRHNESPDSVLEQDDRISPAPPSESPPPPKDKRGLEASTFLGKAAIEEYGQKQGVAKLGQRGGFG